MPITCAGRLVAAASDAIGIEDVFEARIASGGSSLVRAPEEILLDVRVLDHGLDHQVGRDEIGDDLDPLEDPDRIRAALLSELLEASPHGLERVLGRTRERVVEGDSAARCGQDLGDAAAHLPGADDENVGEAHVRKYLRLGRAGKVADACPRAFDGAPT